MVYADPQLPDSTIRMHSDISGGVRGNKKMDASGNECVDGEMNSGPLTNKLFPQRILWLHLIIIPYVKV